jgi:DNA-binding transcriptional LysR family regulator
MLNGAYSDFLFREHFAIRARESADEQEYVSDARMKNDLESVAVFVSVVKEGSFSAAARELGLTPSAVSKRIAGLEDGLGVSLLRRTTRMIALTDAGQDFFEICSRSLSAISDAEEMLEAA